MLPTTCEIFAPLIQLIYGRGRDLILFTWLDKLGEVWVEEEDGIITIDYQLMDIKRTPFDFYVHVHPNGRITGRRSRINKNVIREILELYRSSDS
jgi:hypothetical protein